jgi:hypothetical protein
MHGYIATRGIDLWLLVALFAPPLEAWVRWVAPFYVLTITFRKYQEARLHLYRTQVKSIKSRGSGAWALLGGDGSVMAGLDVNKSDGREVCIKPLL